MSRTYKDLPWALWEAHRIGARVPANWRDYTDWRNGPSPATDPAAYDAWHQVMPHDPSIGYGDGRTRRTISAAMDADAHRRYRRYVVRMIRAGRWDDIEPARHLTGWDWWY